jgi:cytochrome P450
MVTDTDQKILTFMDPDIIECPYPTYDKVLEENPVFLDPVGQFYVISRYEDVRNALLDPELFASGDFISKLRDNVQSQRAERATEQFAERGWVPRPSVLMLPSERHRNVRKVFERALRAGRIKEIDPLMRDTAYDLVEGFASDGQCDIVQQFAVPFPLIVITTQAGAPKEDIWKIKAWTDAWINRLGMMLTDDEDAHAVEMEIEAQHYFKKIIDRLRAAPDETVLSDLVNTPMDTGETLTDSELFTHLIADTFVAGSETTTNAISAGIMLLCQNQDWYDKLQTDQEKYLRPFVEEVLRIESPVQGLFRMAARDIQLHGVTIPEGSVIQLRYGAANRDHRHFGCPAEFNPDRESPGSHLAFGSGIHHCVGAPFARRELYWAFKAFLDRVEGLRLTEGKNDFRHMPSIMHRALERLYVSFEPRRT